MDMNNLILIGTSHIAKESLMEVKKAVEEKSPEIIAIELDKNRFKALVSKKKDKITLRDILKIGVKGYIFSMIGAWGEKKLGKVVGVEPGSEMITAVKLAKQKNLKVALIDQDISITLKRFSSQLTWKEKFNFVVDIVRGVLFRKSEMKKLGIENLDLTKVPKETLIKKLVKRVKERYPSVYRVLIEERNVVMARNIKTIMMNNPGKTVLAIVGAGHKEGILELLREEDVTYSFSWRT